MASRGSDWFLLEFDLDGVLSTDFSEELSGSAQTAWTATHHVSTTLQLYTAAGAVYSDVTLDASGNFTSPEALDDVKIGDPMTWRIEMNAPAIATGQGAKIGKMQRLVSSEIHWDETVTGLVNGQQALSAIDNPTLSTPTAIDEWRKYFIGIWGREPRLVINGDEPGRAAVRAITLNVHVR